jgi:hypothetical protein
MMKSQLLVFDCSKSRAGSQQATDSMPIYRAAEFSARICLFRLQSCELQREFSYFVSPILPERTAVCIGQLFDPEEKQMNPYSLWKTD